MAWVLPTFGPTRACGVLGPLRARHDGPPCGVAVLFGREVVMTHVIDRTTSERRRLARHFFEMVAAMLIGMAVLGALVRLSCVLTGHEDLLDHPGFRAPIMATNMAIGMVVWMRHRRHSRAAIGEMAAAMYVPLVVLAIPFWVGVLGGGALLGLMHVLMLPAMVVAMSRRRDEYVHDHRAPATGAALVQAR
jgi:hypothetical protein